VDVSGGHATQNNPNGVTDSTLRYRSLDHALERALLPDPVLRARSLCGAWARERHESRGGVTGRQERLRALVARMSSGPIAEVPETANEQHYELPPAMLALTCSRARRSGGSGRGGCSCCPQRGPWEITIMS
jgi:hypothetical protein